VHLAVVAKHEAITVRLPLAVRRELERRARVAGRSVSSQIVHELRGLLGASHARSGRSTVPALGRFIAGDGVNSEIPTEGDFQDVRSRLWGSLAARSRARR
jgi:hypothetical protein